MECLLDVINPEEVILEAGKTEDLWEMLLRLDLESPSRTYANAALALILGT